MKTEMQWEGWWEYVVRVTDGVTPLASSAQEGEYKHKRRTSGTMKPKRTGRLRGFKIGDLVARHEEAANFSRRKLCTTFMKGTKNEKEVYGSGPVQGGKTKVM